MDTPFGLLDEAVDRARFLVGPNSSQSPERQAQLRELTRWIETVLSAAWDLSPKDGMESFKLLGRDLEIPRSDLPEWASSDLFRDDVEVHLLEQGAGMIMGGYDRLLTLLPVMIDKSVNVFARKYLSRIALLYVWGFDQEVFVMARAVLDAVLQEFIPPEEVKSVMGGNGRVPLGVRMKIARHSLPVILSEELYRKAVKIKEDGDGVIHEDIEHHLNFSSPMDVIRELGEVLAGLPSRSEAIVFRKPPK